MPARMRRVSGLGTRVFLSIIAVSTGSALVVGLSVRRALSAAFDAYLASLPSNTMSGRPRMGHRMLGAAEQSFIASVDRGVLIAALIAAAMAAVVAVALAAYLSRPLKRLEASAEVLAGGDLAHRVDVRGPREVTALGDALNRMADSLEKVEDLRRRMIADVAHELRNPLAAARAQAEGMVDGILTADEARFRSLAEDLAHLSDLVDDLRELSVAEAGGLRYEMRPVDIVPVIRREMESARVLFAEGVTGSVEAPASGARVNADAGRIAQVVRNLLSNAARHTASGSVVARVEPRGGQVFVSVIDTGDGISPDEAQHLFERFYRADAARASTTGGAGLGLAISRAIIVDHGGEVFAEGAPGRGATIGFSLPLVSA